MTRPFVRIVIVMVERESGTFEAPYETSVRRMTQRYKAAASCELPCAELQHAVRGGQSLPLEEQRRGHPCPTDLENRRFWSGKVTLSGTRGAPLIPRL